jgi:peptidoglycan/xylan/chitin deacetylase (PgdA/CDA1 family)
MDAEGRATLAEQVLAWSGAAPFARSTHRVLTAAEVRELASRPDHSIGAHTTHHLALTTQPAQTKRAEVLGNKATLECVLGRPVEFFAYPYGEFDGETIAIVSHAGFRAAVTVQAGLVSAGTNRLLLPRYEITPSHRGCFAQHLRAVFAG